MAALDKPIEATGGQAVSVSGDVHLQPDSEPRADTTATETSPLSKPMDAKYTPHEGGILKNTLKTLCPNCYALGELAGKMYDTYIYNYILNLNPAFLNSFSLDEVTEGLNKLGAKDLDAKRALLKVLVQPPWRFAAIIPHADEIRRSGLANEPEFAELLDTVFDRREPFGRILLLSEKLFFIAGVTDPAKRCRLINATLAASKDLDMYDILRVTPMLAAAGITDEASMYEMMRVADGFAKSGFFDAFFLSMQGMIDAGLKDPIKIEEIARAAFSIDDRYTDGIAKALPAFVRAGFTDPDLIASVIDKVISIGGSSANECLSEALPGILKAGFTDSADIEELMTFFLSNAGDEAIPVMSNLNFTVMDMKYSERAFKRQLIDTIKEKWEDIALIDVGLPSDSAISKLKSLREKIRIAKSSINNLHISVSLLKKSGMSDTEIEELLNKHAYLTDEDRDRSSRIQGTLKPLDDFELLDVGKEKIDEFLSFADEYEIYINTNALKDLIPNKKDRVELLNKMGTLEFMKFASFLDHSIFENSLNLEKMSFKEILELYSNAKNKLGIKRMDRFSIDSVEHILNPDKGKPIAFVIVAEDDWNGAFGRFYHDINTIASSDYQVVLIETDNEDAIYQRLEQFEDGSIEQLYIFGHGTKDTIRLGKEEDDEKAYIDISDYREWERFSTKFKDLKIFLSSCSTGEGGDLAVNLATHFYDLFKPIKLSAFLESAGGDFELNEENEVDMIVLDDYHNDVEVEI